MGIYNCKMNDEGFINIISGIQALSNLKIINLIASNWGGGNSSISNLSVKHILKVIDPHKF